MRFTPSSIIARHCIGVDGRRCKALSLGASPPLVPRRASVWSDKLEKFQLDDLAGGPVFEEQLATAFCDFLNKNVVYSQSIANDLGG